MYNAKICCIAFLCVFGLLWFIFFIMIYTLYVFFFKFSVVVGGDVVLLVVLVGCFDALLQHPFLKRNLTQETYFHGHLRPNQMLDFCCAYVRN